MESASFAPAADPAPGAVRPAARSSGKNGEEAVDAVHAAAKVHKSTQTVANPSFNAKATWKKAVIATKAGRRWQASTTQRVAAFGAGTIVLIAIAVALVPAATVKDSSGNTLLNHATAAMQDVTASMRASGPKAGQLAAAEGVAAKHPVVLIPGFVTSGLELWQGKPCAADKFRQRIWGSMSMMSTLLGDIKCWLEHITLDPATGGDPPGIKLRAAAGLDAIEFFAANYWVFAKMVSVLADIGYDASMIVPAPYDWRLPLPLMEARDGYFTRLRASVEVQRRLHRERVVIVSHSMGGTVAFNFIQWMEHQEPGWVDRNLHTWISVATPILGTPKAFAPLLSGEMRETAVVAAGGGLGAFAADSVLPPANRTAMFRSWGSVMTLLPVGGPKVWGDASGAPDDSPAILEAGRTFGSMISAMATSNLAIQAALDAKRLQATLLSANASAEANATADEALLTAFGISNVTGALTSLLRRVRPRPTSAPSPSEEVRGSGAGSVDAAGSVDDAGSVDAITAVSVYEVVEQLLKLTGPRYAANFARWAPMASELDWGALEAATGWAGLAEAAPKGGASRGGAGGWSLFTGRERAAAGAAPAAAAGEAVDAAADPGAASVDLLPFNPTTTPLPAAPNFRVVCLYGVGIPTERGYHYVKFKLPDGTTRWKINTLAADAASGLEYGVQNSDGDGTVPLLSLGALCAGGWRGARLNPAGVRVVAREYPDESVGILKDTSGRGGPGCSGHVELLGNEAVLADVVRLVSGHDSGNLTDKLHTNIADIAASIDWDHL